MVSARPSQLRKCRQYRGSGGDAGHLFHDNDTKNICHPYVRKQICQFSGFLLPSLRLFGRLRPYAGTPGGTVRRHSLRLRSDTCRPGRVHRAGYARHRRRRTVHVPRQRGGRGLLRSGGGESRTQPGRAPGEVEAGGCGVYGSGRLKAVVRAVGACGEPSVEIPGFTRGAWKKPDRLEFAGVR